MPAATRILGGFSVQPLDIEARPLELFRVVGFDRGVSLFLESVDLGFELRLLFCGSAVVGLFGFFCFCFGFWLSLCFGFWLGFWRFVCFRLFRCIFFCVCHSIVSFDPPNVHDRRRSCQLVFPRTPSH